MANISSLSLQSLKEAVQIQEQIETLQARLHKIIGEETISTPTSAKKKPAGRRKMSPAARARIGAATKARWARMKGKASAKPAKSPSKKTTKTGLTPEGRARLAASMKARWAERKKAAAAKTSAA